jgi:4'-phosphopantetheinyl transferase
LFGLLLLKKGLNEIYPNLDILNSIELDIHNRPYLPEGVDFNISHSGDLVICAIGFGNIRIGVDIEKIEAVDFSEFKGVMSQAEWDIIDASENPLNKFYCIWTIKESAAKADRRGLLFPLNEINIVGNLVFVENDRWYSQPIMVSENYVAHICTNMQTSKIQMKEIQSPYDDLI